MALVIKDNSSTAGTELLLKDPLINDGSLFLADFSYNGFCKNPIENGDIITDLTDKNKGVADLSAPSELTDGRGFVNKSMDRNRGVDFGTGVFSHINNNLNSKYLCIFWVRHTGVTPEQGDRLPFRCFGGDFTWQNLSLSLANSSGRGYSIYFLGASRTGGTFGAGLIQTGLEVDLDTGEARVFYNGALSTSVPTPSTGLNTNGFNLGLGNFESSDARMGKPLYRAYIENLTLSGNTAEEVFKRDYDYIMSLGEFNGIPEPAFKNNV